jgi:glycosyltransferase involved in cell wall biosynthesis
MEAHLSILIPVFQREESAIRAVSSIVNQASEQLELGSLLIHVRDDASPSIDSQRLIRTLESIHKSILVDVNPINLGMSANIRSMVLDCKATFCTILTDDDWFEADAISFLLEYIRGIKSDSRSLITSFFCPRYSYSESGVHVSTSCRISDSDLIVASNPVNTMRFADKGYILTGLFFRPDVVDHDFWAKHEDNAFFPVLYFASLLCRGNCAYVDRALVHHTVGNVCHWEAWGSTQRAQQQRLCKDFLDAIFLVHGYVKKKSMIQDRMKLWRPAISAYRNRLVEMRKTVWGAPELCIPAYLWFNLLFLIAFSAFAYFSARTRLQYVNKRASR